MDAYNKPIWHFTLQEFLNIQKKELEGSMQEMFTKAVNEIKSEQQAQPQEDTINLEEASKVTGLREKSIYSKVSRLELPCITRGRPLMFSRTELKLWMKLGRPTVTEMALKRRKGEL
jgi:predicted DNA-binding transcriptional regulator AlpA